ncbi:MAG: NAD-dependent epimerase/dehydratase family protein [Pedobacter sp.]|nr:MAG: NAD-dependent epimerase/dehydratase family protein [Pedobacter sp.]
MILVTGGTGFLGSELISQLVAASHSVRALKRSHSKVPSHLQDHPLISWFEADILNLEDLAEAFENVTQVYHCAAFVSFNPADKDQILMHNIQGTAHVVNLCLQYEVPLMHVSSVAALGISKKGEPITENHFLAYDPTLHDYGLSKYEAEMEVWRGIAEGLNAIIVNPSLIIGKATGERGTGAIFKLVKEGLKYYTTGATGLVDVADVAQCMIALMNQGCYGERFIVSAGNISYQQLFAEIARSFNLPGPQKEASPWMLNLAWRWFKVVSWLNGKAPHLTKHTAKSSFNQSVYSNQKIVAQLGFTFKPIEQSIQEVSLSFLNPAPSLLDGAS